MWRERAFKNEKKTFFLNLANHIFSYM